MDSIRIAQVLGITSSAFLAGSNALYTYNLIPTLLSHRIPTNPSSSERQLIAQWRNMFLIGFRATQAQTVLIFTTFTFLAYKTYNAFPHNTLSKLYLASGVICASIVPYTLTIQRALNGALVMRAEKLAGEGSGTNAELAGKGEKRTVEFERGASTEELVGLWGRYNGVRAAIGTVGAVLGAWTALQHEYGRGMYR